MRVKGLWSRALHPNRQHVPCDYLGAVILMAAAACLISAASRRPSKSSSHRSTISRRAVNRGHPATHRPQIRRELATVMDRIEEDVPEELSDGLL